MRELVAVMKALADENRLRLMAALGEQELCLCQLVELLGLATSTVSRHMSILQQARLVDARKDGRWTYFRLAEEPASEESRAATSLVLASLRKDPQLRDDAKRLKQILRLDPETLCRRRSDCR